MSVLAIDPGTSGTKGIAVQPDAGVIVMSEREVRPYYRGGRSLHRLRALANQGETMLAWDPGTGRRLTAPIV